jgi:hypothetical protein
MKGDSHDYLCRTKISLLEIILHEHSLLINVVLVKHSKKIQDVMSS